MILGTLTQKKKNQNRYIYMCVYIYIKWITSAYVNIILCLSPPIFMYILGHAGTQKYGHTSGELTIWFGCGYFLISNKAVLLGFKSFITSTSITYSTFSCVSEVFKNYDHVKYNELSWVQIFSSIFSWGKKKNSWELCKSESVLSFNLSA